MQSNNSKLSEMWQGELSPEVAALQQRFRQLLDKDADEAAVVPAISDINAEKDDG